MRWVTYELNGVGWPGVVNDSEEIVDLRRALERTGYSGLLPNTLSELCGAPEAQRQTVRQAVTRAPADARLRREAVPLRAPIERPGKLICLAGNYREHVIESGFRPPERDDVITPQLFMKPSTCITGDGAGIPLCRHNSKVGWEVELAVVIGKGGRHIPEAEAMDRVFGYTILNDVSERSLHASTPRRLRERDPFFDWLAGKWFDGFAPCGPWIVERDDIADPHSLELRLSVNGSVRQQGNTSEMIIRIPELISVISSIMTLEPGDLIATGTPAGAGMGSGESYLRVGDEVVCEIAGLGTLRNRVSAVASSVQPA